MKIEITEHAPGEIRTNPDAVEKALRAAIKAAEGTRPLVSPHWRGVRAVDDLVQETTDVYHDQMARLQADILKLIRRSR